MRIDVAHDLAVELQHKAQHAMRRGMLRPEIQGEIAMARDDQGALLDACPKATPKTRRDLTRRDLRHWRRSLSGSGEEFCDGNAKDRNMFPAIQADCSCAVAVARHRSG